MKEVILEENKKGLKIYINGDVNMEKVPKTTIEALASILEKRIFEEEDLDAFCEHLKQFDIFYVHPLFEHRWGQRVVRFYDPDGNLIEVGTPV